MNWTRTNGDYRSTLADGRSYFIGCLPDDGCFDVGFFASDNAAVTFLGRFKRLYEAKACCEAHLWLANVVVNHSKQRRFKLH